MPDYLPIVKAAPACWGRNVISDTGTCMCAQVGWPTFVTTKDHKAFVHKLHDLKRKALGLMVEAGTIPIRTGKVPVLSCPDHTVNGTRQPCLR